MRRNHIPPYDQLEPRDGVLVVDGFGIGLRVDRGHLVAEDGVGRMRRTRRFPKAGHGLQQVVVLGASGYISLEAVSWLDHLNIPLIHITADARPALASTRLGLRNARLRRAQAHAYGSEAGFELARYLLGRKIDGQVAVARRLGDADDVEAAAERINTAATLDELLRVEAHTAAEYWALWYDLPIRWVTKDHDRIPDQWHTFGTRSSLVSGRGPRLASNPPNAILNYLFALAESQTVIACHAVGLDPQLGFFHTDTPNRDSLAADIIEAIRPDVEQHVLNLVGSHTFARNEFIETPRGVCRLATSTAHQLAETLPRWYAATGPVVEHVARTLMPSTPTLLTNNKRRAAHGGEPDRQPAGSRLEQGCLDCGQRTTPDAAYCDACQQERQAKWLPQLSERATAYLERARSEGRDPAHGGSAARKRGAANRQHQLANRQWEESNDRPDPAVFTTDILPGLEGVSAGELAKATGLSRPYCSMIKRGAYVPHPKHWENFTACVSDKRVVRPSVDGP